MTSASQFEKHRPWRSVGITSSVIGCCRLHLSTDIHTCCLHKNKRLSLRQCIFQGYGKLAKHVLQNPFLSIGRAQNHYSVDVYYFPGAHLALALPNISHLFLDFRNRAWAPLLDLHLNEPGIDPTFLRRRASLAIPI